MDIETILADVGFPVCEVPYKGKNATYLTFQLVSEDGDVFADSGEAAGAKTIALDLFTPSDWKPKISLIKEKLKNAGFGIESIGPEIYEPTEQLYHIPMLVVEDT